MSGIVALSLLVFADVLFRTDGAIATHPDSDIFDYFAGLRQFAFGELSRGNIPLWNPHILCGLPCLGSFQAALFYPPNVVYLVLPLANALNVDLWFHVTLYGLTMFAWARNRLNVLPAFVSAVITMFSGPFFLHVMCGHLPMLACVAWTPLLFLAYDKLRESPAAGWFLWGVLSAAMQILAGWPQGILMVAMAFALYWALTLPQTSHRIRSTAWLGAMAVAAGLLGAVQLWAGAEASAESVRSEGSLPYFYAAQFSLPPANLLTLAIPGIYGNGHQVQYWGENNFWENCAFLGIVPLMLVVYGACFDRTRTRGVAVGMIVVLIVLALGSYLPLYRLLYDWAPGFDRMRGLARFTIYLGMFASLLAGAGLQALLANPRRVRPFGWVLTFCAVGLLGMAVVGWIPAANPFGLPAVFGWMVWLRGHVAQYWVLPPPPDLASLRYAVLSAIAAAATCGVLAVLLFSAGRKRWVPLGVAALAVVELATFARVHRGTAPLEVTANPTLQKVYTRDQGDYRVIIWDNLNAPTQWGGYGIWGYDPLMLKRFARFIGHTQDLRHRVLDCVIPSVTYRPIYCMLRCKYLLVPGEPDPVVRRYGGALPRLFVVHDYSVIRQAKATLAVLDRQDFDPAETVILNREPEPQPSLAAGGDTVRIAGSGTDHLVIEARLAASGILIVTDGYSAYWRARSLADDPPQPHYDVLPANYVLRAIPLAAGNHRILLEYAPNGYVCGRWISLAAWILFLFASVFIIVWRGIRKGSDTAD